MRRLRGPDKSGAGKSGAVAMEERETEEVGGEKQQGKYSHCQRRLLATMYRGKKMPLLSVQLPLLPSTSLGLGEGFPPYGTTCGEGSGNSFMWR